MDTACIIMAAGKGTRMRSELAKVLHPVCSEPMINYPIRLALRRKYNPIVVIVGHQHRQVRKHLEATFSGQLHYAIQDPPLGTGHAIMQAQHSLASFRGKVVILSGDVPLLSSQELSRLEKTFDQTTVAFLSCRLHDPKRYGRVVRDEASRVIKIVEYVDADPAIRQIDEINTGIYAIDAPYVFEALREVGSNNAQGEYYLTDLVQRATQDNKPVQAVEIPSLDSVLGVNDRADLAQTQQAMVQRNLQRLMSSGVTVLDPRQTYVGPQVTVGTDTILHPGCILEGNTTIGHSTQIGPYSVIRDATISDEVIIRSHCVIESSRIGQSCIVGPFAYLRNDSLLEEESLCGSFVEMKKTSLGKNATAAHFAYLGDATIEDQVNLGAGTITCNFNGKETVSSHIGQGAFIGAGTQLVAPIRIGKQAYIGAGSTVTKDVPDGCLGLSRSELKIIRNYKRQAHKRRLDSSSDTS